MNLAASTQALDDPITEAAAAHARASIATLVHQSVYLHVVRKHGMHDPATTRARNEAIDAYMQELDMGRTLNRMIAQEALIQTYKKGT